MGHISDWWKKLGESPAVRIGLVINFAILLIMFAGFMWSVWLENSQGKKAGALALAQDKKNDERAIAQGNKIKDMISTFISRQEKEIDRLVLAQKEQVDELKIIYAANTEKLSKKYDKIASKVEKRANRFAEKSDEMFLGETTRMIIAGQGNTERALKDVYEKALKEAEKRCYIFELNQASDGVGSGIFVTGISRKSGRLQANGNSYLLTYGEKNNIRDCLRSQIANGKSKGQKGKIVDRSEQERLFRFLLQHDESNIGCMTEPLSRQFKQPTSYGENRDVVMSTPEKLGAIIGYIGDLITYDG